MKTNGKNRQNAIENGCRAERGGFEKAGFRNSLQPLNFGLKPADPSRARRYQRIADEVKKLWWDDLYPSAEVARKLRCSTTTVKTAIRHWHESRRVPVPVFKDWTDRLEQQVAMLFDENVLEIQEIGNAVHLGQTRVMEIVRDVYRRLGKELPDGRTRRSQLNSDKSTSAPHSM